MRVFTRRGVVALLLMFAVSAQAQLYFRSVFRGPTYANLKKIAYCDSTTLLAVGDAATFVKTTDAGKTVAVSTVSNGYEALTNCDFVSAMQGAVCGEHGFVGVTTDGGTTWLTSHAPTARTLTDVKFDLTSGKGFVLTDSGQIIYSANLGVSWSVVHSTFQDSAASGIIKMSAACRQSAGHYAAISSDGVVWGTTNAGAKWDSLSNSNESNCGDMYFLDDNNGWIVSRTNNSWTTNGGRTWSANFMPKYAPYNTVYFSSATLGWALFSDGSFGGIAATLLKSTDGGHNFVLPTGTIGDGAVAINAFRFTPQLKVAWAVGDGGDIRMSTDSGKTFKGLSWGASGPTGAMSFFDDSHGVVCTYANGGGKFYSTFNGGANWTVAGSGENAYFVARMLDTSNAVALFQDRTGYAQYTTNGGKTWAGCSTTPQQTATQYRRIFEVNKTTLYACGQQGLISASVDGGKSWTSRNPADPNLQGNFLGAYFSDAQHGFVCGENGMLLKTANGGSSFTQVTIAAANLKLTDIAFNSATSGWITTDSLGIVFHSVNGGTSWNPVEVGFGTLDRVVFADALMGWIGGSEGQLYMTTDGGTTWTKMVTGTSNTIGEISFTPRTSPDLLWISGGYGMVLRRGLTPAAVNDPVMVTRPNDVRITSVYPNPFSSASALTSAAFTFAVSAAARLDVVNLRGEIVRTIARGTYAAGSYTALWDGTDANGTAVPPGAYFLSLTAGGSRVTRSLVVTR